MLGNVWKKTTQLLLEAISQRLKSECRFWPLTGGQWPVHSQQYETEVTIAALRLIVST